jgi:hypothetical protein
MDRFVVCADAKPTPAANTIMQASAIVADSMCFWGEAEPPSCPVAPGPTSGSNMERLLSVFRLIGALAGESYRP